MAPTLEHLITLYDTLLVWIKEHSLEAYEAVLGNVSDDEWAERKVLAIYNLGKETNFEYTEEEPTDPFLIDMFDGIRFSTHTSEKAEDRKNRCMFQTLFVLIMSGNYDPNQRIVIFVEYKEHYLKYRIFYKSDLEAGFLKEITDPSTALELPFKVKNEYVYA